MFSCCFQAQLSFFFKLHKPVLVMEETDCVFCICCSSFYGSTDEVEDHFASYCLTSYPYFDSSFSVFGQENYLKNNLHNKICTFIKKGKNIISMDNWEPYSACIVFGDQYSIQSSKEEMVLTWKIKKERFFFLLNHCIPEIFLKNRRCSFCSKFVITFNWSKRFDYIFNSSPGTVFGKFVKPKMFKSFWTLCRKKKSSNLLKY